MLGRRKEYKGVIGDVFPSKGSVKIDSEFGTFPFVFNSNVPDECLELLPKGTEVLFELHGHVFTGLWVIEYMRLASSGTLLGRGGINRQW